MPDIFDQIQPDTVNKGDIFDQISQNSERTPADANLGELKNKTNLGNAFIDSLPNTFNNSVGAFTKGAYNATSMIPGVKEMLSPVSLNGSQFGPDFNSLIQNIKTDGGTGSQIAEGLGSAIPTIAMANPLVKGAGALPFMAGKLGLGGITPAMLGMSAFGAGKAALQGQPIKEGATEGAKQGLGFGLGGVVGSNVGRALFNPIAKAIGGDVGGAISRASTPVGTAAGSAAAGAIMAPNDQRLSNAIVGGGLGALSPSGSKSHQEVIDDAAAGHRQILNPGKGEINNLEIKSGKDIDDSMRLAAEQGLIYGKSSDGTKIDTTIARAQNLASIKPYEQQLNKILASDPNKLFDLKDIGEETKNQLNDPNHPSYLKNGEDYQNAVSSIDSAIDAEINRPGGSRFVNAQKLNTIKQGLWSRSYTPDAPNANNIARQLGYNAKDTIEQAFSNQDVAGMNKEIGDRMTLNRILEKAHGRGIQSGKIGKYVSGMVGAITGQAVGKAIPGVGEVVGPVAGYEAGSKLNGILNDPTNVSKGIASRVKLSQLANGINMTPKFNPVPQVQGPQQGNTNLGQFNPIQSTNPQGTILGSNGQPINRIMGALGMAGAIGAGSMFNPLNAQAQTVKEPERLQLPGNEYTKKEEGFQAHPYIDTKGNKTIGYGFKMDSVGGMLPKLVQEGKRPLTRDEGDEIYTKLYAKARNSAQDFSGDNWHSLNGQQQKALTDMAYNMSGKLNGFKKLKQAIENMDFHTASNEIMNSAYAREAKNRASRNAALMAMK